MDHASVAHVLCTCATEEGGKNNHLGPSARRLPGQRREHHYMLRAPGLEFNCRRRKSCLFRIRMPQITVANYSACQILHQNRQLQKLHQLCGPAEPWRPPSDSYGVGIVELRRRPRLAAHRHILAESWPRFEARCCRKVQEQTRRLQMSRGTRSWRSAVRNGRLATVKASRGSRRIELRDFFAAFRTVLVSSAQTITNTSWTEEGEEAANNRECSSSDADPKCPKFLVRKTTVRPSG